MNNADRRLNANHGLRTGRQARVQVGPDGVCVTYDPNNKISKIKAHERVRKIGIAVMFSQGKIQ